MYRQYKQTPFWVNEEGNVKKNGKIIEPYINHHGYKGLTYRGKTYFVHIMVAWCFPEICGEWFDGCQVDHTNTISTDNRALNLKVCTPKENTNNPLTLLHKSQAFFSTKNPNHRAVDKYTLEGLFVCRYECISDAERDLGLKPQKSAIYLCAKGKIKTSHGYIWKYPDTDISNV